MYEDSAEKNAEKKKILQKKVMNNVYKVIFDILKFLFKI